MSNYNPKAFMKLLDTEKARMVTTIGPTAFCSNELVSY